VPGIHVNGIDLYYEEHGQGEPLLLMAPTGWPGSVWDLEQVPFFARTHRVITYDQRGVGRSAKPDHEYTTALLGDDALGLLHAIDAVPAHVLGFSIGGRAAQWMALKEPGALRSLILAASHPGSRGAREGIPLGLAVALGEHGYGLDFWIDHLLEELPFSPAFRERSPDKIRQMARRSPLSSRRSSCTRASASSALDLARHDLDPVVGALEVLRRIYAAKDAPVSSSIAATWWGATWPGCSDEDGHTVGSRENLNAGGQRAERWRP
jgi:pimeloyl-ACP methyl ester carboxylesterase